MIVKRYINGKPVIVTDDIEVPIGVPPIPSTPVAPKRLPTKSKIIKAPAISPKKKGCGCGKK